MVSDVGHAYIIMLPKRGVDLSGYLDVPKIGESTASSGAQAVTQYLHRVLPADAARIVAGALRENHGNLGNLALVLPKLGRDAEWDTPEVRDIEVRMQLACELADRSGSTKPEEYFGMAGRILNALDR